MSKHPIRAIAVLASLIASLTLGVPVAAAAAPASPNGCSSSYAALHLTLGYIKLIGCSGTYTVNIRVDSLQAGGFSGQFQAASINGPVLTYDFCDNDDLYLGGRYMYWIYLSPTKEPWC